MTEYNELGLETLVSGYDEKGALTESVSTVYTYNEQGEVKDGRRYGKDGALIGLVEYAYSELGDEFYVVKETNYGKDGSKEVLDYGRDGLMYMRTLYDAAGNMTFCRIYVHTFGDGGELVSYEELEDGHAVMVIKYKYKENGDRYVSYRQEDQADGTVVCEFYNDDGLIDVVNVHAPNGELLRYTTYLYYPDGSKWVREYDANGKCVNQTHYSANGSVIEYPNMG